MSLQYFFKPSFARLFLFVAMSSFYGCSESDEAFAPDFQSSEWLSGGDTTVTPNGRARFDQPLNNLPTDKKSEFHVGKAFAQQPWIKAPTITAARDGLGPLYNARTCLTCHINGGKGFIPQDADTPLMTTLVRLSVPTSNDPQGVQPHPVYGDQIQTQSTSLAHQMRHAASNLTHDVPPEAYIHLIWKEHTFTYPDGHQVTLKQPSLDFRYLGYGPFGDDTMFSVRVAPAIHGMGLIESIAQADIDALADPNDINQDGISGRVNRVWNEETHTVSEGRFGWKANRPTLAMTVAGALTNDLGVTNPLFPQQPCTSAQPQCLNSQHGTDEHGTELSEKNLDLMVQFNRHLAPVKARNLSNEHVQEGRELFYKIGCQNCHQPSYQTAKLKGKPYLSEQIIWPYSDFLLHDMGPDLADNRPDFEATGQEWRTPPLWGVGLRKIVNGSAILLHDGRANTIEEAILWHGGEAQKIKLAFTYLNKDQREKLILFVNSI